MSKDSLGRRQEYIKLPCMQATKALSKQTRSTEHFDWVKHIDRSIITEGFEHAVASGNWTIKRFRMDRKGTTQVRSHRER